MTYRPAATGDLPTLTLHRHLMWSAIGRRTEPEITEHDPRYRRWLLPRLRTKEVVGFIAQDSRGSPLGTGLVWFRPDQPRPKIPMLTLPYVLSMYTDPAWRGKGIASAIVRRLVQECRKRGYASVVLHASEQGRSVYTGLGFERTWEMRLWIDPTLRRRRRSMVTGDARRERKARIGRKGLDRGR